MTDHHVPDAKLRRMILSWAPLQDTDAEKIADEIIPAARVCDARMWLAQCKWMLPDDENITSDYHVATMLDRAASSKTHVGVNGRLWTFPDGSMIVANGSNGDRVLNEP